MGFKLVERVYNLYKKATSPSEQAVLLALAYRANDRTLFCYPKQETLAEMTHLSRATVVNALNALRRNGFIDWKSGGLANKKGKYGRPLSNDYKLNLPLGKSKKAFLSVMSKVGMDRSLDILHAIKSEERQGELEGINSQLTHSSTLNCYTVPFAA